MNLSDLTIIIPSIGRKSVVDAINSVDKDCPIIVAFDYPDKLWNYKESLNRPVTECFQVNFKSAGLTKQYLIDKVKTKYFCILDDDDQFIPGYLNVVRRLLSSCSKAKWVATHYTTNLPNKELELTSTLHTSMSFKNSYFKWTDNKTEYELNKLSWIYPCSEVIVNTDEFRKMQLNSKFKLYRSNWDEVVAFTNFMMNNTGFNHNDYGILYSVQSDSISHTSVEFPTDNGNLMDAVKDMMDLYVESDNKVWMQAIINALEAAKYNYKHY